MAHSRVITLMDSYADRANEQGDPSQYLQQFAAMHDWWHGIGRMPGFLVFHWHAIRNLKRSKADNTWAGGVTPFSENDWKNMNWPYKLTNSVAENDFDSFSVFSRRLESWHNEAHMAVTLATGQDLMNPLTNIMLRDFWRLHYFIDGKFLEALDIFNPSNVSPEMKIEELEHKFHSRVREI
ncbi:hypothetical protein [Candidatus Thiosymbion oneisti]|uniref:hypothetical protein n=1 Tax=Candidatus Thiosymbion oneisti TaxID=589554 RepID=UPI000B7CE5D7|nr:hypothetical protein [Candidatus Thiosymbion oneisti]